MTIAKSVLLWTCLFFSAITYADNYPKNSDIDIQHYEFKLWLSDKHDSIRGEATLFVRFKMAGQKLIRLDLTNAAVELLGKGMIVSRVVNKGVPLSFSHQSKRLTL